MKGNRMTIQNDLSVLDRAITLAAKAHGGMRRKLDHLPYIMHPMEVAVVAGTLTEDEEVLAAAVLHDTVEDTGVTLEEIASLCGERVARLVLSETEDKHPELAKEASWHLRKEESLDALSGAIDPGVRILWLADKLTNIRSYRRLWEKDGDAFWSRLNQSDPAEQGWYYRSIADILSDLSGTSAWQEYRQLVDEVFGGIAR